MKTVKDILQNYLKRNGYDGLAGDDCGCSLSNLAPCDSIGVLDCVPGYKCNCNEGCYDHMVTEKIEK